MGLLWHNRITTALSMLCGLLILIVVAEITLLDTTDFVFDHSTSDDNVELATTTSERFTPKSLGYFTEILERPLLFEDRKMPPEPQLAATPVKPKAPLRLKLEGVAISSDRRIALLRNNSNNQALQLAEGLSYNGWTLQELDTSGAKFVRGEDVTELLLETGPNPTHRRK